MMIKTFHALSPILLLNVIISFLYAESEKPNILFIYTDDQSTRTVSCYPDSHPWVKTPQIDQLARQGVLFTHAYIASWCMPSRLNMLTGLHQHASQSMRMIEPYPKATYNPEKCRFWARDLKEHGYHTAMFGKWHTGVDSGFGRDWDEQKVWNRAKYPENAPNYYDHQLIETNGGDAVMTKGYTTDLYTEWAIDFIQSRSTQNEKPWFLWLCYGAVHGPFTPAKRHLDDYHHASVPKINDLYKGSRVNKPKYVTDMNMWEPNKVGVPIEKQRPGPTPVGMIDTPGRTLKDWIRQYNQGVLAIDEGVGKLLKSLKDSGQDENTIVIFTSDQGFAWGQHGFKSKVAPYFSTIAAPLIFKLPKKFQNEFKSTGTIVNAPVSGIDIPSTLYSLIDKKTPWTFHGQDLTPLLKDPSLPWHKPAVVVHTASQFGADTDRVPSKTDSKLYHGPGVPWYVMVSLGRYKYIRTFVEGEIEELYDLISDPEELHNLAVQKKYQLQLEHFRKIAISELKRTDAKFVKNLPAVKKLF